MDIWRFFSGHTAHIKACSSQAIPGQTLRQQQQFLLRVLRKLIDIVMKNMLEPWSLVNFLAKKQQSSNLFSNNSTTGRSPGLGSDYGRQFILRCRGFKSQHRILDGHDIFCIDFL